MYAVIEDSGRQFRVREKDTLDIAVREQDNGSNQIIFDKVLLVGDEGKEGTTRIGQPWLEGVTVTARIEREFKDQKVSVVKFKRRKGYHRKQGHRQRLLHVTIEKIHA